MRDVSQNTANEQENAHKEPNIDCGNLRPRHVGAEEGVYYNSKYLLRSNTSHFNELPLTPPQSSCC